MRLKKLHKVVIIVLTIVIIVATLTYALIYSPLGNRNLTMNFQLNANPQFEIGQTFSYLTSNMTLSGSGYYYEEDVFTINDTKEIDGRMYYEVIRNWTSHALESCSSCQNGTKHSTSNRIEIFYYGIENGTCIGRSIDPLKFSNQDFYVTDVGFFAYWMLGLKEGAAWEMNQDSLWSYKFEVLGMEEVNDILCFKVKMQHISKGSLQEIRHYWVDSERRILIEEEVLLGTFEGKFYKYLSK